MTKSITTQLIEAGAIPHDYSAFQRHLYHDACIKCDSLAVVGASFCVGHLDAEHELEV